MQPVRIAPSLLSADFARLADEIALCEAGGADLLHVDVMDGCFCPMTTVGPPIVKALRTSMVKDVHLMIEAPLAKVADYVAAGADLVMEGERRALAAGANLELFEDAGAARLPGAAGRAVKPARCSFQKKGGPMKTAATMTPMKTVQPIMVPWIRQAHKKAGCTKSGKGRSSSFQ